MRLWYRDRVLHILLALLVGTFTFSFTLLAGVEENSVPHVGVTVTGVLMAADLFLFLFFLDRFVHRLRPVAVAALAAAAGRHAFESAVRAASGPTLPRSCAGRWRSPASRRRSCARAAPARSRRSTRRLCPVRAAAPQHARSQPRDRRLRPGRSGRDPGLRRRADRRRRRGSPPADDRPRRRADDRAGSRVRRADHGRRRDQGALAGGQRPDDGGPGDQPSRRPAAPDRSDRLPRGGAGGARDGPRPHRLARLGAVPRSRRDRDPRLRRLLGAGGAAAARDAGGAARRRAAGAPPGGRGRARAPRGSGRPGAGLVSRSRPRLRGRQAGARRRPGL